LGWTVLELLRAATEHLAARGGDDPRLDAELLLAQVMGTDRLGLYVEHDQPVDDAVRTGLRALVKRRAAGEPVAYILGRREFHGLDFEVDGRCLVPRPETEHLVDEVLAVVASRRWPSPRVLELGTGSGCIAVSLAHELGKVRVVATDVSEDALAVARANAARLVADADISFRVGDLWEPAAGDGPFELVVSNPPYISTAEMERLPVDVREYEPGPALDSGSEDPVAFHRRIIAACGDLLAPDGVALFELPDEGAAILAPWLAELSEFRCRTVSDLAGIPRVLVIERVS